MNELKIDGPPVATDCLVIPGDLMPTMRDIRLRAIRDRLKMFNGNKTHTAKSLGIGVRTLQRILKEADNE